MDNKKDSTRLLLSQSLQNLMKVHPFEKITIKMITDGAGVIRPTFYNYFQDKYELIEWIFKTDIIDKISSMAKAGMHPECLKYFFTLLEKNKDFYRKAFAIEGQNSFEDIMLKHLCRLLLSVGISVPPPDEGKIRLLTPQTISLYYALGVVNVIKAWLCYGDDSLNAEEVQDAYGYLISHSVFDMLH